MGKDDYKTAAEAQFHTSSIYALPKGYNAWVIRNDYPSPAVRPQGGRVITTPGQLPPGQDLTPWLDVDFRTEPNKYLQLVKEYFLEGMFQADFVPQNNTVRQWYHAAWLHYGPSGREPIRGLTYEGSTPPDNLARTQTEPIGSWANAFFNAPAASVLGQIWADPNNPQADESLWFPEGSVTVKTIFTTATDEELPIMKGAPTWDAAITSDPTQPQPRNDTASPVRLIQLDIAVKDCRAPSQWVFGAFWYNGRDLKDDYDRSASAGWNRLIPIGLQWGNDPQLTQDRYYPGVPLEESWVSPETKRLLYQMGGKRPFMGWNGRVNGPTNSFISACMSCHSVAQVKVPTPPPEPSIVPPTPVEGPCGKWTPVDDSVTMKWFRNIPSGEPFTRGAVSTDFNMQARSGIKNYFAWLGTQKKASRMTLTPREVALAGKPISVAERTGPEIRFM